jgi:hypothetical protein
MRLGPGGDIVGGGGRSCEEQCRCMLEGGEKKCVRRDSVLKIAEEKKRVYSGKNVGG